MPNWTDDQGMDWFNKLECKRCLQIFEQDDEDEVPVHDCLGELYTSKTYISNGRVEYHEPVRIAPPKRKQNV